MICAKDFIDELEKNDVGPFIEVPCTILCPIINYIIDNDIPLETPANEATAMGIAAGHHMGTNKVPVVMMQNSGLCNALNAITSLHCIYDIPALLIVTWRGEFGTKDAPEHDIMGAKLESLLEEFGLSYRVITLEGYQKEIKEMVEKAKIMKEPTVLVLRKGIVEDYELEKNGSDYPLYISETVKIIKNMMGNDAIYVSTTGFISRLSFHYMNPLDFYMVGSMGHALPIGIGIAQDTDKKIVILDGDSSCLMHIGAMASVGTSRPNNLVHIVLDNEVNWSTGNQPSLSPSIDFSKIAEGFGYEKVFTVHTVDGLNDALKKSLDSNNTTFIHIKVSQGDLSRSKMKRVSDTITCPEVKKRLMKNLEDKHI